MFLKHYLSCSTYLFLPVFGQLKLLLGFGGLHSHLEFALYVLAKHQQLFLELNSGLEHLERLYCLRIHASHCLGSLHLVEATLLYLIHPVTN